MQLLRSILVMATLAFWLAGANHCRLEQLPGMEFLACTADAGEDACAESSDCAGHEDEGCADDSCAAVEGAIYKTASVRLEIAAPHESSGIPPQFLLASLQPIIAFAPSAATPTDVAPPELSRLWQFSLRAAAPPRAPSFIS